MFGFFKKRNVACPVSEEMRIWLENTMIWLIQQFGEEKILSVKTLLPTPEDFPVKFNGTEQVAYDVLSIVAKQMDVDANSISISFYDESPLEFRNETGLSLFSQQYEDEQYSTGLYHGRNPDGTFSISVESNQLKEPDKLVATLAHELAHIKILGEGRLPENGNDEYLTDLVTVFFGLGIFNANATFRFYTDIEKWSYTKQGYLTQQEWGYSLALYAYIRNEKKPDWIRYLTPNIQSDFKKSELFILNNPDKVLFE